MIIVLTTTHNGIYICSISPPSVHTESLNDEIRIDAEINREGRLVPNAPVSDDVTEIQTIIHLDIRVKNKCGQTL